MDIKSREQINHERQTRDSNANNRCNLTFDYNATQDIMIIEGIAYEGDFLRYLHGFLEQGNVTLELKGNKVSMVPKEDNPEFSCPCGKSYKLKMHLANHQKKCEKALEAQHVKQTNPNITDRE